MSFADWLRESFLAENAYSSIRDLAALAAQQAEALVELKRTILRHSPCMVHEDCAPAEEQAAAAIQAGEDFKKKYE